MQKGMREVLFYKPEEISSVLRLSLSQVYTLCREGTIPSFYIGRNLRIPYDEFHQWLEDQLPKNG